MVMEIIEALGHNTNKLVPILERIAASLETLAAEARFRVQSTLRYQQGRLASAESAMAAATRGIDDQDVDARPDIRRSIADILAAWPELAGEGEA
jgi:hypothetical protein